MNENKTETDIEAGDQPLELRDQLEQAAAEIRQRQEAAESLPAAAPPEPPAESRTEPSPSQPPAAPSPAPASSPADPAPAAWSEAAKAKWAALDPEIRAEIARREAESANGARDAEAERQFARQLRDVISPYMPLITAEGGTPERAVRNLLNSAFVLRAGTPEQKIAMIQQTCQQYGVPLERLGQPQPQLHPVIAQLEGQVAELRQARQQEALYRQQQEAAGFVAEIHAFAQAPGHEHFQAVKGDMAMLLQSGLARDLQDAYDRAIWARPDLRGALLQQQRAAEAKARAGAAKRAGASVTGAPGVGGAAPPPANRSLRDELMENLRAASGRV